jgi:hypothetical protein
MFRKSVYCFLAGATLLYGQDDGKPLVPEAQPSLGTLRPQVAAGIVPQSSLTRAQEAAADARDADLLARMLGTSDLTEEQAQQLEEAAARRVDRATKALQKTQELVQAGLLPAQAIEEPSRAQAWAQSDAGIARSRAELVRAVAEMAHAEELIAQAPKEKDPEHTDRPAMERFGGNGIFTRAELDGIKVAFENQFGKPLPVSADGNTAVHRAMGFDHSNRVDVALAPDTPEGLWLRRYLELSAIPYYAFRTFIPGKATAAHIHIGLPSTHIFTRAESVSFDQRLPRS